MTLSQIKESAPKIQIGSRQAALVFYVPTNLPIYQFSLKNLAFVHGRTILVHGFIFFHSCLIEMPLIVEIAQQL